MRPASGAPPPDSSEHLLALLSRDGRPVAERRRLVALIELLLTLPPPPDPHRLWSRFAALQERLREVAAGGDGETLEEAFLELYAHLHGHQAPYSPEERARVDATGGYWAHAGGLTPILKAPEFLRPDSASVDYGAGNGLQLLLVQRLAPHRRTVQVEISSAMLAAGRALESWLGIPGGRVEWRCADIGSVSPAGFDLVYLYRPVRPDGPGGAFYRWFADELARSRCAVTILSVADCLRPFLAPEFEVVHADGQLTCYRRPASS
ncbi:MAG: hypothetical protein ACM3O7_04930 [Acidobacteriota bacterium]